MRKKIAVIPGDGICTEIFPYINKIIDSLKLDIDVIGFEVGLSKFRKDGVAFDENMISQLKECNAILFGAISTPPKKELTSSYKSPILTMRNELDLYVNLRSSSRYIVKNMNEIIVFRENTEGLYCQQERVINEDVVIAEKVVTGSKTRKLAKFAFDYAMRKDITSLTIVSKSNVLKKSDGFFVENCKIVGADYPEIEIKEEYVDATCYHLVRDSHRFHAILTENLYGDIISDLIAGLGDGLGVAISECYGDDIALFEPVHGSALDIAGKNTASPYSCLLCLVSLMEYIGEYQAKIMIESIVIGCIEDGYLTKDLGGHHMLSEIMEHVLYKIQCEKGGIQLA